MNTNGTVQRPTMNVVQIRAEDLRGEDVALVSGQWRVLDEVFTDSAEVAECYIVPGESANHDIPTEHRPTTEPVVVVNLVDMGHKTVSADEYAASLLLLGGYVAARFFADEQTLTHTDAKGKVFVTEYVVGWAVWPRKSLVEIQVPGTPLTV